MLKNIKRKIVNLLRSSEKYTKTDMVYLAKGGFWLSLGRIISSASSFLLAIAFANLLNQHTYGLYKYVLSVCGILALSTLPELGIAVARSVARGYEGTVKGSLRLKIKCGLWGSLGAFIVAGYYQFQNNETLAISFLIAGLFIPFMEAFTVFDSHLQGKKLFAVSTQYNILIKVFAVGCLVTVLFFTRNLYLIFLAYFAGYSLLRALFYVITIKKHQPNSDVEPDTFRYGKHLTAMKMLSTGVGNFTNIFLFQLLGSSSLAILSFALAPIEQVRGFLGSLENLILPKISQDTWQNWSARTFYRKMLPLILLVSIGVVTYIFLAPMLYQLLFPRYIDSVVYSQVFSISLIFTTMNLVLLSILRAKQKIKELHIINVLDVSLNIIIVLPMIYFFGLWGFVFSHLGLKIIDFVFLDFFALKK